MYKAELWYCISLDIKTDMDAYRFETICEECIDMNMEGNKEETGIYHYELWSHIDNDFSKACIILLNCGYKFKCDTFMKRIQK